MEENINQSIESGGPGSRWSFAAWWERATGNPLRRMDKVILIVILIIFLFIFYVVLDANKYAAMVHVVAGEGKAGINPTATALDFGDLSRGVSAVRRVDIENGTFMPVYVWVVKVGSISDLITIDKSSFLLKAHTKDKIEFTTYIPASAVIDQNYTGRVFIFKIPTFGL